MKLLKFITLICCTFVKIWISKNNRKAFYYVSKLCCQYSGGLSLGEMIAELASCLVEVKLMLFIWSAAFLLIIG